MILHYDIDKIIYQGFRVRFLFETVARVMRQPKMSEGDFLSACLAAQAVVSFRKGLFRNVHTNGRYL